MTRLAELLQDLSAMPGVSGAFLCCREGVVATTLPDVARQKNVGLIYLNVLSGAFSLGHFVQEIYCNYLGAILMIRPVSRGCVLVAKCKPGMSTRLVDISLTMTVKSIEDELNGMELFPPPIDAFTDATANGQVRIEANADNHLR